MATASETDLAGTPPWSRSGFTKSFKRKGRKPKGSETNSIASSGGVSGGPDVSPVVESPSLGRNSNDSSRKLSLRLGAKRRGKLGRTESESGSEALSRTATDEGPAAEEDSSNYYTEEEEESSQIATRPTLSPHSSHIGYLTASSPLITTETVISGPLTNTESTSSVNSNTSSSRSNTLKAPTSASQRRSPSPVGRLKDAFKSRRSSTSPAGTESGRDKEKETPIRQGGHGAQERKGSPGPIVFEDRPLVEEPGEKTPSPRKPSRTPHSLITKPPSTPPGVNGPATVVTPPTPTDATHTRNLSTPISTDTIKTPETAHTALPAPDSAGVRSTASGHRRVKSAGQPSKLSNAISAPLTPAIEEVKTPGGTITEPTDAGGFFSLMFSAAQSAATSLTNTITVGGGQRNRSATDPKIGQAGGEEVILPPGSAQKEDTSVGERKQLAIETLGSGNLSLSHLGISDNSDVSPMTSSTELVSRIRRDEMAAKAEDDAAARAVSIAYSERINGDRSISATPSVADTAEQTPTPTAIEQESGGIRRTGSVRSRLSGRRRRTRGSSAATGVTMAPTISGPGSTIHRLPGFSVAPNKRQREFHNLFRSVPEDDYLIEDYSAALQRDILLQGRMYISEGHICFSSNILGWVTNLVMSFDEIISVEKKATAMIFQNGIIIQTLQAKNVFASLLNRDTTYDLIISIWKITHPNLRSTLNGAPVEGSGSGDKTEKVGTPIEEESASEEVYDEEEEEDDADEEGDGVFTEPNEGSTVVSEAGDAAKAAKRLPSNPVGTPVQNGTAKIVDAVESVLTGATATLDFPGPPIHAPTDCGDSTSHLDKLLMEDTIPAPLGKIYSLMFGPASGKFMRKWLVEDQKSMDLQLEDDGKGLDNDHKSMTFSYIKPLNGSIGPKQTKCIISQTLEQFDLNKAVTVSCSTQNPDVPSGNIFVVKTKYCLSWGPNNSTKFVATCQIEWSGKSWLKVPIEKGANDGQLQYQKDIVAALKATVTAKNTLKAGAKGKAKGVKRKKDSTDVAADQLTTATSSAATNAPEPNWGLFEPIRKPLGPVADLVHPSVIIAFLTFMVFFLWWRLSVARAGTGAIGMPNAQRMVAYEEIWQQEESELWKWLEERAGLEGSTPGFLRGESEERRKWLEKQRVKDMGKRLDGEMEERQMKEAMRVTKERLEALEKAVDAKEKGKAKGEES